MPHTEFTPDDLIQMAPLIRHIATHATPPSIPWIRAQQLLTTPTPAGASDPRELIGLLAMLRDWARRQAG